MTDLAGVRFGGSRCLRSITRFRISNWLVLKFHAQTRLPILVPREVLTRVVSVKRRACNFEHMKSGYTWDVEKQTVVLISSLEHLGSDKPCRTVLFWKCRLWVHLINVWQKPSSGGLTLSASELVASLL